MNGSFVLKFERDNQPLPVDTLVNGRGLVYAEIDGTILGRLETLAADDNKPFYAEGPSVDPGHWDLIEWAKQHDGVLQGAGYHLWSFRQAGRGQCMQIVVGKPDDAGGRWYADMDLDLGNPLQDLDGTVVHMGEVVSGETTDHLKLHDTLAKGAAGTFLYYTVQS